MTSRTKFWALSAGALALSLALAGCGGGGGSTSTAPTPSTPSTPPTTPTTPTDPPPRALSFATDLNRSVAALTTLSGDADAEGSALMMAKDASEKIGTRASDGNSMAAMNSAAMVLKARSDLEDAIDAAKAAKMAAEEAKANTDDADVIAALDGAISDAEDGIKAAEDILDGNDLAGYVEMVTGDDEDDLKTAADKGEEVAMAIAMALAPTSSTVGSGTRVNTGRTDLSVGPVAANVDKANRFAADDHQGMTFAMIVGEDNLMEMRIAATGGTQAVKAASFAGMPLTSIATNPPPAGDVANGAEFNNADNGATYKGIPGTVFCAGSDCKVEGDAGSEKLTGSWYFAPDSTTAYYIKAAGATTYSVETMYATYGHWLVVNAANGQATVNTYAMSAVSDTGSWNAPETGSTDAGMRESSATYSGMAAGRSVHKTLNSDGGIEGIQSGRFTADVTLTATFAGAGSTLGGTIDNFQGTDNPDAVDSSWTVKLNAATTTDGTVTGVTDASGQDGAWTGTSYGEGDFDDNTGAGGKRPTGIYGNFNAHFTDGHVAGAYATRKE